MHAIVILPCLCRVGLHLVRPRTPIKASDSFYLCGQSSTVGENVNSCTQHRQQNAANDRGNQVGTPSTRIALNDETITILLLTGVRLRPKREADRFTHGLLRDSSSWGSYRRPLSIPVTKAVEYTVSRLRTSELRSTGFVPATSAPSISARDQVKLRPLSFVVQANKQLWDIAGTNLEMNPSSMSRPSSTLLGGRSVPQLQTRRCWRSQGPSCSQPPSRPTALDER